MPRTHSVRTIIGYLLLLSGLHLAPKAPWLVAEGQLEGYDRLWEASNSRNLAYLTYKPIDAAGKPVDKPATAGNRAWNPGHD